MNIDLDDIEAKAKAATPGPWKDSGGLVNAAESAVAYEVMPPDRAYIAAVNPAVMLEILHRLRATEEALRLSYVALEHFRDCGLAWDNERNRPTLLSEEQDAALDALRNLGFGNLQGT